MDIKLQERSKRLADMGLKYDGQQYFYHDINFHWTDITCMSDDDFDRAVKGAEKRRAAIDSELNGMDDLENLSIW